MAKRLAVITGAATNGYGGAITRRLLKDGFRVLGTYERTDSDQAQLFANSVQAAPDTLKLIEVDHGSRADLQALLAARAPDEKVDCLVNAQFFFAMEDPDNFDWDLWDRSIAVNLTAPAWLFHHAMPHFSDNASIVTITSTEGFTGSFGASAYAATKAAIHNLTKSWANIAGRRGIRANAIAAGWIGGVMDTDEIFNMSRSITPLGRLGTAEEIAATVSFLVSRESSFVNGSVLVADGGYSGVDTISQFEYRAARRDKGAGSAKA